MSQLSILVGPSDFKSEPQAFEIIRYLPQIFKELEDQVTIAVNYSSNCQDSIKVFSDCIGLKRLFQNLIENSRNSNAVA